MYRQDILRAYYTVFVNNSHENITIIKCVYNVYCIVILYLFMHQPTLMVTTTPAYG